LTILHTPRTILPLIVQPSWAKGVAKDLGMIK